MNTIIHGTSKQGLIGATIGFFVGFAAVSLFGPTVRFLQTAAGLSAGLAGLLISIPNLTGSLLRIPFSAMVNRDGGRIPFLILLSAAAVGVAGIWALIAFAPDRLGEFFPLLLVFGALGGAGIATFSVGISQTSFWFPQRAQGSALATFAGIGNVAPGLFALLLGFLIPVIGLSGSYLAWLIFLLIGIGAYAFLGRNPPSFQLERSGLARADAIAAARRDHGQELFPKGNVRQVLMDSAKVWQTWALVFVYFTTFGGFIALTSWLPKYWGSFFGLDLKLTGLLTALFSVSASLIRVAGGPISDRLGGERAAIFSLALIVAGAVVMSFALTIPLAVVGIVLLAIGMGVANAATFKLVPQEVPNAVSGAAGWVGGLGAFGGFVIPNFLAAFLTTGSAGDRGYATGFLVFVGFALASAALVFVMQASRARRGRTAAGTA
jgi:NNP family nitrate/nitrite transporter-like MFS transporter